MNDVFENFVVTALREPLGVSERVFVQRASAKHLMLNIITGRVNLKPDISWWEGSKCLFVGTSTTSGRE
jgi:hypothetical protein